jgi:hypothetical protein
MADKPTALRLAGYWAAKNDQGEYLYSSLRFREETAAELRRLVAENERLHQINQSHEMKLSVRGYEIQIADLKAVNQELLEVLRLTSIDCQYLHHAHKDRHLLFEECPVVARINAAIAKAEGQA